MINFDFCGSDFISFNLCPTNSLISWFLRLLYFLFFVDFGGSEISPLQFQAREDLILHLHLLCCHLHPTQFAGNYHAQRAHQVLPHSDILVDLDCHPRRPPLHYFLVPLLLFVVALLKFSSIYFIIVALWRVHLSHLH